MGRARKSKKGSIFGKAPNGIKMTPIAEGNIFIFEKEGDGICGKYKGSTLEAGTFGKQYRHTLEVDGEKYQLWGSKLLDKLLLVKKNTVVLVEYHGMRKSKKGKNTYRLYSISLPEGTKLLESPEGVPL